jgi:nucleoside phosphorylase
MPYNLAAVIDLVETAFTDEDLNTFCLAHFRRVYAQFAAGQQKGARVRLLVEFAERQRQLSRLLELVREANPGAYEEFEPRLGEGTTSPPHPQVSPARQAPAARAAAPPVDFVIVTALEEERDAVLAKLPDHRKLPPSETDHRVYFQAELPATFADGSTCTYNVVALTLPGMGRLEAANAAGDAVRRWRPRFVLMVGIAGGISDMGVSLGDVLISDQVVDYEVQKVTPKGPQVRYSVHQADPGLLNAANNYLSDDWLRLITAKRPRRGKPGRRLGPIATGDKVIAAGDVLKGYRDDWPKLLGVEMEAGGVAKACFQAKPAPGFFMVRGVSDLADAAKDSAKVGKWRSYACDVAAAYAIGLLGSGPVLPALAPTPDPR